MTAEALHRWADAFFLGHLGLSPRKTFGCPGYYAGRRLFAFVYRGMLGIKCDPEVVVEAVKSDAKTYRHFNPGDGVMQNWLLIAHSNAKGYDKEVQRIVDAFGAFQSR